MGGAEARWCPDDDRAVREPIVELLRREGFRVLTAGSSLSAIPILAREHVDILFTDIAMPDQDGIELAKQAKALQPQICILFATGYVSRAEKAASLGKLLLKPVRAHEIGSAITEALHGRLSPLPVGGHERLF
jgi:CheY-like chemotaxis protein